jgi:hypothetical protein
MMLYVVLVLIISMSYSDATYTEVCYNYYNGNKQHELAIKVAGLASTAKRPNGEADHSFTYNAIDLN